MAQNPRLNSYENVPPHKPIKDIPDKLKNLTSDNGKNLFPILCSKCNSIILSKDTADLVRREVNYSLI